MQRGRRSALTLAELVVVLTILAILAASASVLSTGVIEQARYDATKKTLDAVRQALLGNSDYTRDPVGFIADYSKTPSSDSELKILVESYLKFGAGVAPQLPLKDGWGRDMELSSNGSNFTLLSNGADGMPDLLVTPANEYDKEQRIDILPADYRAHQATFIVCNNMGGPPPANNSWKFHWKRLGTTNVSGEADFSSNSTYTHTMPDADLAFGTLEVWATNTGGNLETGHRIVTLYPGGTISRNLVLP